MIKLFVDDSQIHGIGIFTKNTIRKNIIAFEAAEIVEFEGKKHLVISQLGKLVNHQKKGNTVLKRRDNKYYLVAIRDIKRGEELTSNYTIAPKCFSRNIDGYKEL